MPDWTPPDNVNLVDLGFMDSRSKLIDLAAFRDRTQRAGQDGDFRVQALKNALSLLSQAQQILGKLGQSFISLPGRTGPPKA